MIFLPRKLLLPLLLVGLAVWAVRAWSITRTDAAMQDAQRVFGAWIAGDEVQRLATDSGLWAIEHPEHPQATAPDAAYDGSAPIIGWAAHEVDRTIAAPRVPDDGRGIVVTRDADGTLVLDQLTAFVPEARRASVPAEVRWIAFARYRENDGFWTVEGTGESIATERVDLRVVAREDGRRIGRVTAEGAPPYDVRDTSELFQPHPGRVTHEIIALLEDPDPAPTIVLRPDELACPADAMPDVLRPLGPMPRACSLGATTECVTACTSGDAGACLGAARSMDHGWTLGARRLYRLSCLAGSSAGCTRDAELYVAALPAPTEDDEACAARVYDRACAAGDPSACEHRPPAP